MITNNSNAQGVQPVLGAVFSANELETIALVCSLDSLSVKFDWTQITGVFTKDGMVNILFERQGMWMMTVDQFKRLRMVAESQMEFERTLEFHAQSLVRRGRQLDKVA